MNRTGNGAAALAAAALVLSACGDSSGGKTAAAAPSPTAVSSSSVPLPTNVESETCRTAAAAFFEIPDTLDQSQAMAYEEFERKFIAMSDQVDTAMATCTSAVENPVRKAMYHFAMARTGWSLCTKSSCEETVGAHLRKGFDMIDAARAELDKRE